MFDVQGRLKPFRIEHGRVVAEWVVSRAELFLVAPLTTPPLTGEKVCAWTSGAERGYVYAVAGGEPAAYGELNDTPGKPGELWIGHFLVAPWARGRNIGKRFCGELLEEGFARRGAVAVGLVVFPDNQAAIRCYRSVGLTDAGPQRRRFPGSRRRHEMRYMKITREQYLQITAR
jgi:RimJ/RimL family protein N-acetyltransferase